MNCPSAPIFQIFALKQKIKPIPMIIKGHAFTKISAILSALEKGDKNTWYSDSTTGKFKILKIKAPIIKVKNTEITGPIITQ